MECKVRETVALKEDVVDDIKKTVITFANCHGGKLHVGINDDGDAVCVDDIYTNLELPVSRNPKLSNVFYRLERIGAYGTGLGKTANAYDGTGKSLV